ncbi:hypothetical protein PV327_010354 [Microctonus hyperodae]|uniref:Arrestin C-terminal-like domain-containing protein n=1 Tax=Microctonus hyperodae TaxID=165561 RepID=A0AA39KUY7_MICHY|nr:hypothetical protein PV327_010354 [Microctonus hyperodae]
MMSGSIKIFEIHLDNPTATYASGEIIIGKLIIKLDRVISLRALKLKFKGSCKVHWTETRNDGRGSRTISYDGEEIYFRNDLCLFGSEDGSIIEMAAGLHTFPFIYNLPHGIPSNFEHRLGKVQYSIKAIFDRPWKSDYKISKQITINAPWYLDSSNDRQNIGFDEDSFLSFHHFYLPCISQGNMALRFRVPRTFFACNEEIEATINIYNLSDSVDVTKIEMTLRQKLEFISKSPSIIKKEVIDVQSVEKLGPFPKEGEVKIKLRVPSVPFSFLTYCSLININYRIIISVHVSGWHCPTTKHFDVVIGSKPPLATIPIGRSSISYPIPNYSAPSAPMVMPVEDSDEFDREIQIPSVNLPYPPAICHNTSEFPYSHQHSYRNIGFNYSQSTSPRENSKERK